MEYVQSSPNDAQLIYKSCGELNRTPEDALNVWRVLGAAREARANPPQSGYHVRTAGMTADGQIFTAGNLENSLSDAFIHGETAVISHAHAETDSPVRVIGF